MISEDVVEDISDSVTAKSKKLLITESSWDNKVTQLAEAEVSVVTEAVEPDFKVFDTEGKYIIFSG